MTKTITIDDTIFDMIETVKTSRGLTGYDHGKPVMCDDGNAILEMYVAWKQINHIKRTLFGAV